MRRRRSWRGTTAVMPWWSWYSWRRSSGSLIIRLECLDPSELLIDHLYGLKLFRFPHLLFKPVLRFLLLHNLEVRMVVVDVSIDGQTLLLRSILQSVCVPTDSAATASPALVRYCILVSDILQHTISSLQMGQTIIEPADAAVCAGPCSMSATRDEMSSCSPATGVLTSGY